MEAKDRVWVSKDRKTVKICPWECENIEVTFGLSSEGRVRMLKKIKVDAQIYDPSEYWIPLPVFQRIVRKAAAILLRK